MKNKTYKKALLCGLFFLPLVSNVTYAEVSPDQYNLMLTAASKDGGVHFDTLVDLLIAANPNDEASIRELAEQMRPEPVEPEPAPEPAPEPEMVADNQPSDLFLAGWEKQLTLSGLYTTGNTSQKSLGIATKFQHDGDVYHQTIDGYFDINTSNGVTDRRRYGLGYKGDYDVSETSYISGFAGYDSDSFGGFNKRFTLTGAYGVRLFENDELKWSVEAGPALLITKATSMADYVSVLTAYAGSIFDWTINDRSNFSNETKFYVGNEVVIENKAALTVKVSEALSTQVSFDVVYNRDAPIGRKTTDTITRVGVQYDF